MAERRMFAKSIIGSARFLMMPPTSRLLYYDLGMYADDDGVVEAFTVLRQTNANEDDLKILVAKGFVKVLNEELVSKITDWNTNNFIRNDRYHPSIYKDLLLQIESGIPAVDQRYTEVSIGKDRIGKNSKKKVSKEKNKEKYGEFQNVLLTETEYKKLKEKFPKDYGDRIDNLSIYMLSKGKQYKNHYATILSWARKEERNKPKPIEPKKYTAYKGEDWERDDFEKAEMPDEMRRMLGKVGKTI